MPCLGPEAESCSLVAATILGARAIFPVLDTCADFIYSVRIWRMSLAADAIHDESDYPFSCEAMIHTGHTANIFNARMLPHSSRM